MSCDPESLPSFPASSCFLWVPAGLASCYSSDLPGRLLVQGTCTSIFSKWNTCSLHNQVATSVTLSNVTCYLVGEARKRSYFVSIGFVPNSNEVLTKFGFIRACRDRRQKKTRSKWDCSPQETISKILAFTALMMKNASLVFLDLINLWQHSFILPAMLRSRR